eukprot:TRINITY_DN19695_c0_g1_i2.p1 TRINITY_DN19695_c0_g1~~TRINITY_DN19695_c0_g1_i2.p1  ORF type:complete len:822 (+),score=174.61 TRINITY_DN19695_c0_g1_i2:123-2468(+)
MAMHPFGEQGFYPSKQRSMQANLMWSSCVFTRDTCFELDENQEFQQTMLDLLTSGFSSSGKQTSRVESILRQLLVLGHDVNWQDLGVLVDSKQLSLRLLQEMAGCTSQPVLFALHAARLFHRLARKRPLKAAIYTAQADWYKEFTAELVEVSSIRQIAAGRLLSDETVQLAVQLADQIDATALVASQHFQDIIQEVWITGGTADLALEQLLVAGSHDDDLTAAAAGAAGICAWGPSQRHYAHVASYCVLVMVQLCTSSLWSDSQVLWALLTVWAAGHLVRVAVAPDSGFFSRRSVASNAFLVAALAAIWAKVHGGRDVPRDLDCITMLLHFLNIGKMFIAHPQYGPLVIMVQTMIKDITRLLVVAAFALTTFYCALTALYRGRRPRFSGEQYQGPMTMLVNVVWGPQLLWSVAEDEDRQSETLILSELASISDAEALDWVGFFTGAMAVVVCPILLLNLLIAMMASSYTRVERDSDIQWKRFRASAVLVARELPMAPLPFNIPADLLLLFQKLFTRWSPSKNISGEDGNTTDEEGLRKELVAIEQMVAQWETKKALQKLQTLVTMDQVERVRMQGDAVMERVNLVYNATDMLRTSFSTPKARVDTPIHLPKKLKAKAQTAKATRCQTDDAWLRGVSEEAEPEAEGFDTCDREGLEDGAPADSSSCHLRSSASSKPPRRKANLPLPPPRPVAPPCWDDLALGMMVPPGASPLEKRLAVWCQEAKVDVNSFMALRCVPEERLDGVLEELDACRAREIGDLSNYAQDLVGRILRERDEHQWLQD